MAVYKRGKWYWYEFVFDGVRYRESTKQGNKRIAEEIERARRTQLAKAEVGIRDKKPIPTLAEFVRKDFLPYTESRFASKPKTLVYYRIQSKHLTESFGSTKLDAITPEMITDFIDIRRRDYEVSSINRALQVLRRILGLAAEWGTIEKSVKVTLVRGERRRSRVLSHEEELAYLEAAAVVGAKRSSYPGMLRDVSIILIDCALRPEEAYRMRWEHVRKDSIFVPHGKTAAASREIPLTARALGMLERRRAIGGEWVFPAETKSGHMDQSTLKKQHAQAVALTGLNPFVPYALRHTALTRWSRTMDPYTLGHLAGHSDFSTTRRYVHPSLNAAREAMERANGSGPHNSPPESTAGAKDSAADRT